MMWSTHYLWWGLALLLIGAEVLAPGFFLLWVGLAAAMMGVVLWLVPDLGLIAQSVLFAVLALATCLSYWRWLRPGRGIDAHSLLNRRAEQLIGRRFYLETAISNGRGKARVGDSLWLVEGPDLPVGACIEVTSVQGAVLYVQPALD